MPAPPIPISGPIPFESPSVIPMILLFNVDIRFFL
jgi:hypothetical protein